MPRCSLFAHYKSQVQIWKESWTFRFFNTKTSRLLTLSVDSLQVIKPSFAAVVYFLASLNHKTYSFFFSIIIVINLCHLSKWLPLIHFSVYSRNRIYFNLSWIEVMKSWITMNIASFFFFFFFFFSWALKVSRAAKLSSGETDTIIHQS